MGLFKKKEGDEPADQETTPDDPPVDADPAPGQQAEVSEAEPAAVETAAASAPAGDPLAEIVGPELSEASDDALDLGDDLMDIFAATEADNEELSALTAGLEEVDTDSLFSLARQILGDSRDGSNSN